jgi:hypothetical protein
MNIDELPWERRSQYWDFVVLSPQMRVFRRAPDGVRREEAIPNAFEPGDYVFMGVNQPQRQVHVKAEDKLIAQALVIEYLKDNEKAA